MANVLDNDIDVGEIELQWPYCVHFRTNALEKGMKPLIPSAMDLTIPLMLLHKDGIGIK